MDICNEKKFIDLESNILLNYKDKELKSLIDEKNNVWSRKEKLGEGGYGSVFLFESFNKEYSDLAIKFFDGEKDENEIKIINYFKKNFCDNFIKIGVKVLENKKELIIMERVDGDLLDVNYDKIEEKSFFNSLIDFLISSFKCSLELELIYTDIKLENLGYRMCKKKEINFTFLDYGSFSDLEDDRFVSSFFVNLILYKNKEINIETSTCFSTILVLILLRLLMVDYYKYENFDDEIKKLQKKKKFDKLKYYQTLEEEFVRIYHRKLDSSLKKLFKMLKYILTNIEEDLDLLIFLKYLEDCKL